MDRKRIRNKSKPIQLGQKEQLAYMKAVEKAEACDNLPPLVEDFINNER